MRGTRRRGPDGERGLAPHWRALLLGGAGLALAGSMVVGSLTAGPGTPREPTPGTGTAEATRASLHDETPTRVRERCGDGDEGEGEGDGEGEGEGGGENGDGEGFDPAESLRPSREGGPAVDEIRERGSLIVGIDQNSYRWGYRLPESGEIVGFDIDLARAIAEDLLGPDPDIVFRAIPTDQREEALEAGTVDMVVRSMSITCDRLDEVAFSTSYFETGQQLLVPGDSTITDFDESMAGQRVCSASGSTASRWLERESHGAVLLERPNHLDCLVLIQLGLAEALMTDSALAAGHMGQDPSMRLVGPQLTSESYGVAMALGNDDLVRWVNAVLDDYRGDGPDSPWHRSFEEWLSGYLPEAANDPPEPLYHD
ncbi:transporter substrate-binding domain-containing protein [Streptomyces sp. 3MP-14]|uniref:Transporter substrate-binding domain-containing protein n=1 Tax=Streptomyces mimosae TaxID=2586635 RepID=A0A5N6ALX6_9ACTN|nr:MULTISPECIES: glutamate ABC transporter substrate-binding protein [Streptomyces]KAB8169671.1 transporter substrate-binding domain-containing protein [Streptomyces mimosae]KAB8178419.1 transporter substrate-binding domain-containing protein [Streptomyces sp. 3MP-14]